MARPKRYNSRLSIFNMIKMFGICFSFFILVLMVFVLSNTTVRNAIVPQHMRESSSEKKYFSTLNFPTIQRNNYLPSTYSGIGLGKNYPYDTKLSYDNPFLSVSFWLRIDSFGNEKFSYIFGNRDIECIKGKHGFGYAIFLNNKEKRLYLVWKSDRSTCEKGIIVNTVPLNEWFHIAIVFSTERDGSSEADQLSYPTRIELYYNGDISSTLSSQRFLSYEDEFYIFGLSPSGKHVFTGRVYYLMLVGYNLSSDEVESIYRGEKDKVESIKRSADSVLADKFIDYDSMEREEANKIEIYDIQSMMQLLTKRYISDTVFHPSETPSSLRKGTPKPRYQPDELPLIDYADFIPAERIEDDIDTDVAHFIVTLMKKNETRFMEGTYWYKTPESLFQLYSALNHKRASHIRQCFQYAWSNYKELAWGYDEMGPRTGFGNKNWGHIGMTLIDGLDTLYLMGFKEDVKKVRDWVEKYFNINRDRDLSVFELNIRIVGGFLSMYDLTDDKLYLNRAIEVADILLIAFNTYYNYPRPAVNPQKRDSTFYPWSHNRVALADVGTLSLEFSYLSRVTGNKKYKKAIEKINKSLSKVPTMDGLLPSYIRADTNAGSGVYTMGALGDSYYEYLLKAWIQGGKRDKKLQRKYNAAIDGMHKHLLRRNKQGLLYLTEVKDEKDGGKSRMGLLECFAGGMLSLGVLHNVNPSKKERDLTTAKALTYTCMRFYFDSPLGVASELTDILDDHLQVVDSAAYYLFRPEAIESLYYLNQITGDPIYREWGWKVWKAIEQETKTSYGFGHLQDVRVHGKIDDRTESYFFSETLKYFYLLFKDEQVVDLMNQVLNTEAHPLSVK